MRRLLATILFPLFFALSAPLAFGQATQSFNPTAAPSSLAVTTSSARVAFPSPGPTAVIVNPSTTVSAYINMGSSTVVATTSDFLLGPGCTVAYNVSAKPYIAAITASGSVTLQVQTGSGLPTLPAQSCYMPVSFTGTTNSNLTQVNSATVNVGTGAAGAGTQRVAVASDSTVATITNPVGVKGADGSAIVSAANPLPVVSSTSTVQQLTPAQQGSAANSLVICAAACNLFDANVTIGATSGYLMIHNATSAPGDGAVTPRVCLPVISNGTNGSLSLAWPTPKYFSTGATAVFSTTGCFTQTGATAAFISGDAK